MTKTFGTLVALFFTVMPAFAEVSLPERLQGYINDYAKILNPEAVRRLEERYAKLEKRSGHQVVVAVFSSIEGQPIDDLANKLFTKWKIGAAQKNDGVLLVLAMSERSLRVEVGYGLESVITDAVSKRIISEHLAPFLKEGHVATALLVFGSQLDEIFEKTSTQGGEPRAATQAMRKRGITPLDVLMFCFALLSVFGIASLSLRRRRGRTIGPQGGIWGSSTGWGGRDNWWGGGGFGGFGGGGGFSGGGGGLSGGGGASGKW